MSRRLLTLFAVAAVACSFGDSTSAADLESDLALGMPQRSTYSGGSYTTGYAPAYTAGYAPAYTAGYAPSYTAGYAPAPAYTSYYGPTYTTYSGGFLGLGWLNPFRPRIAYRPIYGSCNPCNPCATPCDPCGSGGPCGIPDGGGAPPRGTDSEGSDRTFKKQPENGNVEPPVPGKDDDSEFEQRGEKKGFQPTPDEKKDDDPPSPGDDIDAGSREALKPADGIERPKSVIEHKKPAPAKPPADDPERATDSDKTGPRFEGLHLDGKITFKPVVERTRLVLKPVANPREDAVVRTPVNPNAGWKPAGETRVVRK